MVVRHRNKPKDLYLCHDFESLKQKAETAIPHNDILSLLNLMDRVAIKIKESIKNGDQEMEYVYLHRHLDIFSRMIQLSDFVKKGPAHTNNKQRISECGARCNEYVDDLRDLIDILKERYSEKAESANCIAHSTKLIEGNVKIINKPPDPTPKENPPSPYMDCESFYESLLKVLSKRQKFKTPAGDIMDLLIIDTRSTDDYKNSHILHNCLSIPAEIIKKGLSAAVLGSSLDRILKITWDNRSKYSEIILIDWNSKASNFDPNSKIAILKDIMTNWDPGTTYNSCIKILNGGYEEVLLRYPHITSNPKVKIPTSTSNSVNEMVIFDYPLSMLEDEKPPPPKIKTAYPTINRTMKPKLFENVGEFTENAIAQDGSKGGGDLPHSDNEMDKVPHDVQEDMASEHSPSSVTSSEEAPPSPKKNDLDFLKKEVENLRKLKPVLPELTLDAENKTEINLNTGDEGDVVFSPLKGEGTGSSLKRSYSSPNIAQMKDDEPAIRPTYSRSNKPSTVQKPRTSSVMFGERNDSTFGNTALGLTGLKNFANNCYMNSIIQCLSNTEELVKELTKLNKPPVNMSSPTKGRIANEVISILRALWSGDIRCYSLRDLKDLMGCYQEIFRGANHQDSHEFLIILLEYLHNDLNIPAEITTLAGAEESTGEKAWGEFRRKNCSVIQRLFYGQDQSTVSCSTCAHTSITFGQFFNLFVPIPEGHRSTLEECLQLYMSGEKITGWQCPKCGTERNAIKKMDITRLPPILIIALKRFSQESGSWLEKKETVVTYPLEGLNMTRFSVPGSEQRYSHYNLHALSTHTGTLRSGHYRAIAKNYNNNKWYMFDDSSIYTLSPQEVGNNSEVYILFFHAVK